MNDYLSKPFVEEEIKSIFIKYLKLSIEGGEKEQLT